MAVSIELWRGGVKVADFGLGYVPDGEGMNLVTVPAVAPGADYKVRVVSLWDEQYFAESGGSITIQNPGYVTPYGSTAVDAEHWALYR